MAISELFSKYQNKDSVKFGYGMYGSSMTGIGIGVNGYPVQDLDAQLQSPSNKFYGKSPVTTAHSILESCRWNPLTSAAFNDKVWEKSEESTEAKESSSVTK